MTNVDLSTVPDPDNVVMEFQVVGTTYGCCITGVPGSYISTVDGTLATGGIGVKTYEMAGSFDQLTAYQ